MNEDLEDPFQWSFGSSHHTEPKTNIVFNLGMCEYIKYMGEIIS